jgi:hypothetical protein
MGADGAAEGEPPLHAHFELGELEMPADVPEQDVIHAAEDDEGEVALPGTPPADEHAQQALSIVALHPARPVHVDDSDDELALCIVCYEAPSGTALDPCGHDHFCEGCATQFRTCPLCRAPLVPRGAPPGAVARPSLLSEPEVCNFAWVGAFVYGIIFIGGYIENCYNVPGTDPDDGCVECFGGWAGGGRAGGGGRSDCHNSSYLQAGAGCYKQLEDIPAVQTGAALGGTTYFVLIILTQALGMACEIVLIRRCARQRLFCAILYVLCTQTINLPRQGRDKPRGKAEKEAVSAGCCGATSCRERSLSSSPQLSSLYAKTAFLSHF